VRLGLADRREAGRRPPAAGKQTAARCAAPRASRTRWRAPGPRRPARGSSPGPRAPSGPDPRHRPRAVPREPVARRPRRIHGPGQRSGERSSRRDMRLEPRNQGILGKCSTCPGSRRMATSYHPRPPRPPARTKAFWPPFASPTPPAPRSPARPPAGPWAERHEPQSCC
jgi:hypothetical protein